MLILQTLVMEQMEQLEQIEQMEQMAQMEIQKVLFLYMPMTQVVLERVLLAEVGSL